MWEDENGFFTGLRALQKRLGCEGCFYAHEKARLKALPCCTKIKREGVGLTGDCLEKKPVGVY